MAELVNPTLRELLISDPDGKGFADLTYVADDRGVLDILNATHDTVLSFASLDTIQAALHEWPHADPPHLPLWIHLRQGQKSDNPVVASVCDFLFDVSAARYKSVDMGLATTSAMLGVIVSAGLMAQEQADALKELGRRPRSYAESIWGLGTVITLQEIGAAR